MPIQMPSVPPLCGRYLIDRPVETQMDVWGTVPGPLGTALAGRKMLRRGRATGGTRYVGLIGSVILLPSLIALLVLPIRLAGWLTDLACPLSWVAFFATRIRSNHPFPPSQPQLLLLLYRPPPPTTPSRAPTSDDDDDSNFPCVCTSAPTRQHSSAPSKPVRRRNLSALHQHTPTTPVSAAYIAGREGGCTRPPRK